MKWKEFDLLWYLSVNFTVLVKEIHEENLINCWITNVRVLQFDSCNISWSLFMNGVKSSVLVSSLFFTRNNRKYEGWNLSLGYNRNSYTLYSFILSSLTVSKLLLSKIHHLPAWKSVWTNFFFSALFTRWITMDHFSVKVTIWFDTFISWYYILKLEISSIFSRASQECSQYQILKFFKSPVFP